MNRITILNRWLLFAGCIGVLGALAALVPNDPRWARWCLLSLASGGWCFLGYAYLQLMTQPSIGGAGGAGFRHFCARLARITWTFCFSIAFIVLLWMTIKGVFRAIM